jgi:hypothetical protein
MSSASQPVLPVSPPTEHWTELSIVDRILRAADWPELKRWAEVALGPSSFELGVCCGIVENVAGSVIGLLDLLKTFILAGLYARARQGLPWWDVVGLPEYLVAKGAELVLGAELKKAHDTCEALMRQVMYVVKHPREFLKTTKDNYLRQYTQKWELFQRLSVQTDLTSQFRAGEIFGEVLLDVIMLVLTAEAAVKLAAKIPELVKLADGLGDVVKLKPRSTSLGGAASIEDADVLETPSQTSDLEPRPDPKTVPDMVRAIPESEKRKAVANWYKQLPNVNDDNVGTYLRGTDFSKPVLERTLMPGDQVQVWVRDGGQPGNHFAPSGTDPSTLGINVEGRHLETYEVTKPMQVMETTAAEFPNGLIPAVGGNGGGQQYIMPPGGINSLRPVGP